ncbi:MAG: RnfABCDGE type electron transport complex subunit D [Bacillota bacterium]
MNKLIVSVSPHIWYKRTTTSIMLDVIIALTPALIASVLIFGVRAALVTAVCVGVCVLSEWLYEKAVKRPSTIKDLSACITGLLLAFSLPVTIPLWQAAFGSIVAIVVIKQLFGGIGKNFANPSVTARVVMFLAFSGTMSTWVSPDGVSSATPLAIMSPEAGAAVTSKLPSLLNMFLGTHAGCLGETSAIALILGGIYLIARKVISFHTPVAFIGTVFVLSALLGVDAVNQVLAGGLLIGAIFMASDYSTSPMTSAGKLVYGAGCGLITVLIRLYGSYPEGVSFAILLMNIMVPYIDRGFASKPFGRASV